jgi:uncharacterized cupin superfamily protein
MTLDPKKLVVRGASLTRETEQSMSHPFNPRSQVFGHALSEVAGLKRNQVWRTRIAPGKESFAYHFHRVEEEWMFVLQGRALVEINDETVELGPGDFVGFPVPDCAHLVKNPGPEDLVFLSGGERVAVEVADFPRDKKRMVRMDDSYAIYDLADGEPFAGLKQL